MAAGGNADPVKGWAVLWCWRKMQKYSLVSLDCLENKLPLVLVDVAMSSIEETIF